MSRSSVGWMPASALEWLYSSRMYENSEGVQAMFTEPRFTLAGSGTPASSTTKSVKLCRACSPRMPAHQTCERRYWKDAYPPSCSRVYVPPGLEPFWMYSLCRIQPCRLELVGGTLRNVTSAPYAAWTKPSTPRPCRDDAPSSKVVASFTSDRLLRWTSHGTLSWRVEPKSRG